MFCQNDSADSFKTAGMLELVELELELKPSLTVKQNRCATELRLEQGLATMPLALDQLDHWKLQGHLQGLWLILFG